MDDKLMWCVVQHDYSHIYVAFDGIWSLVNDILVYVFWQKLLFSTSEGKRIEERTDQLILRPFT